MDVLKQKGKYNKMVKSSFKSFEFNGRKARQFGPVHITEEDYGSSRGGLMPLTNTYLKKIKDELKVEYRAVKRNEKHKLKMQIQQDLLDED